MKNEMTKEEKSTQKILNKIMSEELLAHMFYTGCIVATDKDEVELFEKIFVEIAEDELNDHFMTLK
jgi:ferritin